MSEIKVGEYVRTNEGYIGKLIQIIPNVLNYYVIDTKIKVRNDGMPKTYLYSRDGYGFKHSFDIIDLIEEGDIIHLKENDIEDYYFVYEDTVENLKEDVQLGVQLVGVITREQFKEVEYKVC